MKLPKDPAMLLSIVNMKLRDEKIDLTEFCRTYFAEEIWVTEQLSSLGYHYNAERCQFVR